MTHMNVIRGTHPQKTRLEPAQIPKKVKIYFWRTSKDTKTKNAAQKAALNCFI